MRKVVFLGAIKLVWCLSAADASYDGIADYWYSHDDGVILDSIAPIPLYRSNYNNNNYNKSRNLRTRHYNASANQGDQHGRNEWVMESDIYNRKHKIREYLRTATAPPFIRDPTLNRLQNAMPPGETWRCAMGPDKILEDGCNHCVCVSGQIYLCTAKKCRAPDASGVLVYKSHREKQRDQCIERQKIKSFNCNRCWCSSGKILCTVRKCSPPNHKPLQDVSKDNDKCVPGESLPSLDNCNTCGCNSRGQKYCSAMTCGIIPRKILDIDVGCVPQTWYSLSDTAGTCNECYCVDGKMSFCYMKLCQGSLTPDVGYTPVKLMAAVKKSTCRKGAVMFDECSKCICTYKEEWRCYTRLIDKCSGQDNTKHNQKRKFTTTSTTESVKNIHPLEIEESGEEYEPIESVEVDFGHTRATRPPKKIIKDSHDTNNDNDIGKEIHNVDDANKKSNEDDFDTNKPNKPRFQEEAIDSEAEKISQEEAIDSEVENVEDIINDPEAQTKAPQHRFTQAISESINNGKEFEEEDMVIDENNVDKNEFDEETEQPTYINDGNEKRHKPPKGKFTHETTKKRNRSTRRPTRKPNKPGQYDINGVLEGAQCKEGESFTQGVKDNCQGCFCTDQGQWKCFSVKDSCREPARCWIGVFEKNKQIPCSYCHCGLDAYWMCFTDETCSQQIKKTACDAIACSRGCKKKHRIYGFCHRDQCRCAK